MTINSNACFGCHLRCGVNKVKRENADVALQNDAEFVGSFSISIRVRWG